MSRSARADFFGQVVVVTGASGGLGSALCRHFAAAGATVAALDIDRESLVALATAVAKDGGSLLPVICDVTDADDCARAIARVHDHLGGIDVLINNAGISHRSAFAATAPAVIRKVMEVNFFGAVHCTHAALPHLLARRGQVVAISSVAGFAPLIARTGYAASKHALHGFFDSLRSEVEDQGVNVLLVCPSFIRTGIDGAALAGSGAQGALAPRPRQTTGGESTPDDIAARIVQAVRLRQRQLLPGRTARLAWWLSRFAPSVYARLMKKRLGAEMATAVANEMANDTAKETP